MSSPSQLEAMKNLLETCDKNIKEISAEDVSDGKIHNFALTLLKTEKMIFMSHSNINSKREIFELLMTRYDEIMGEIMSIVNDDVTNGNTEEGFYLEFCDGALERRTRMKMVCDDGISR